MRNSILRLPGRRIGFAGAITRQAAEDAIHPRVVHSGVAIGLLIYVGVGVVSLLLGSEFLNYDAFGHHGQHQGILLVEVGVAVTVASVMITIFYSFAELVREP